MRWNPADPFEQSHRDCGWNNSKKAEWPGAILERRWVAAPQKRSRASITKTYCKHSLARTRSATTAILRAAKRADMLVEQPTKFDLVVKLKTPKAFGLAIPQSLLIRGDEVIE
jgi:hypothetical protein